MKFKVQIDGKEHDVQARPDGSLVVDGDSFSCQVEMPDYDRRLVQIGEKSYDIRVVEKKPEEGAFLLEIAGERVAVAVREVSKDTPSASPARPVVVAPAPTAAASPSSGKQAQAAQDKAPEQVKEGVWAPVPGKIVSVLVRPGDRVKEGQAVVVLEAMKMENELHAPREGTVTAVLVSKGDQVERGQLLVAME